MIVAFDLETTGLSKHNDEIIEIALIKFDETTYEQIDVFSTFINPGIPVPELISNITNIFDSDLEGAPRLEEVKEEILNFIGDCPLLGHNVFFDRDFFIEKGIDVSKNIVVDTFFLANFLCYRAKSLNLEMLCKHFNIPFSGAHRAINDVQATINLYKSLLETFNGLLQEQKDILAYVFCCSEDKNVIYLQEKLYGEVNKDFGEFERILLSHIGKYIDTSEANHVEKLKIGKLERFFEQLGAIEKRENQIQMTNLVYKTLSKLQKTVIEAPTGLGKSFAYLIPSILHSVKSGEKVFVSTKTKTLQDQLYYKDLSLLKEKLGVDFSFCKLKGRSNYISVHAFFNEFLYDELDYSKTNFLLKISLWLLETKYGELDELNYYGVEYRYLKLLNSDSSILMSDKNTYRDYEFLLKARGALERSNVVVINHSLLFSDMKSENGVLGKIKNLVLDEAHNIEESVTDSLKISFSEKFLGELFGFIENILKKNNIEKIDIQKSKESLLDQVSLFCDYCNSYLNLKVPGDLHFKNTLIKKDFYSDINPGEYKKKMELLFIDISDKLSVIEEYDFAKEILQLQTGLDIIKTILTPESEKNYIRVISSHERNGVGLEYTLLNPGEYLLENLWDKIPSVVLTSATLQISESFDYVKKIFSLDSFGFHKFESDFDYKKQATVFIPNDLGSAKQKNDLITKFLGNFYGLVRGKTLTLFTSFQNIKNTYTSLNIDLKKQGVFLYPQSIGGSKTKLISFYMESPENSILLGTDSFWEGVDIPGDNLKYLVIHKFPFGVPSDPIFQARSIFFKDPFSQYAIPKAVIKLKQGFGRLIRSKNDTGLVVMLDQRIYSTGWGGAFYDAFPQNINKKITNSQSLLDVLESKIRK